MNGSPPTLETIARHVGVSKVTVSRILRGHPSHSAATRARVLKAASDLGWRPNPLVAAHMAQLRSRAAHPVTAAVAVLTHNATPSGWRGSSALAGFVKGIHGRAEELGFHVDMLWAREPGLDAPRIRRVLDARGIHGVLLVPPPAPDALPNLDLGRRVRVAVGFHPEEMKVHYSHHHIIHATQTAFTQLAAHGYRRPGLAVTAASDAFSEHMYSALFLRHTWTLPPADRVPPFMPASPGWTRKAFRTWFVGHRPDAIAFINPEVPGWLKELGVSPGAPGLLHLNRREDPSGDWTGLILNHEEVGAVGMDLLVEQLHLRNFEIPRHPLTRFVEADWHEGSTLPVRRGANEPDRQRSQGPPESSAQKRRRSARRTL